LLRSSKAAPSSPAIEHAAPPRLETPAEARKPCEIYTLPTDRPVTQADRDVGYATRGAQILLCDGRRDLAVKTHDAEHELEDRWAADRSRRARPWWRKLIPPW